jgi:hypothetical protein
VNLRIVPAIATAFALASAVQAQDRQRCILEGSRQTQIRLPSGQYNSFIGGNVLVRCPAKSLTLRSDSLESFGDEGRVFVIGNVHYDEPRLSLTSNYLTYYQRDERIVANGNVNARLPSGSTLRGPFAEYQRVIPGTRPAPRLYANGRPTITIVQKDSAGKPTEPTTVLANNVTMVGDSLVYAGGAVVVTRQEVVARGDSVDLDSEREITVMMRNPSIEGRRDRPFTLSGDRIELTGRNRKLDRVLSKGRAKAVSEDMTLASDTIDLRLADDLLQRAIAWGPSRARASSSTQQIVSDSIDVLLPNQRLREMRAVRSASAEGRPDSIRFRADTTDWMRGDTIVARFDTVIVRDTARVAPDSTRPSPARATPDTSRATADTARAARDTTRTRLRELIAVGNAKSFYHLPPADSTQRKPAINYVFGREIVVDFKEQRVAKVTVIDKAAGVYLEPKPATAPADTTRPVPGATRAPANAQSRPPATPNPPPGRRPR